MSEYKECPRPAQKCWLCSDPVHAAASRTSILPVTAAEMRAVRSSLRWSMASWTLAMRASILAVSRSRKDGDEALFAQVEVRRYNYSLQVTYR